MDMVNKCIGCDVTDCVYNAMGQNCSLHKITVIKAVGEASSCGNYKSKY